jgi:hypothetical protein
MKKLQGVFLTLMGLALLGIAVPSQSQAISEVTTRAGIMQNDYTDWGQLGLPYTEVASGSTARSFVYGVVTTFSQPGNLNFERVDQSPTGGWSGNFATGDHLLWNWWNWNYTGTITLTFNKGLLAVGAQIEGDTYGTFGATIQAFNKLGVSLGSFSEDGYSAGGDGNSAIFLGVSDTSADIFKIVYTVNVNGVATDFAINQLAMRTSTVPLPPSVLLLGSGLLGLLGLRRFRKQ